MIIALICILVSYVSKFYDTVFRINLICNLVFYGKHIRKLNKNRIKTEIKRYICIVAITLKKEMREIEEKNEVAIGDLTTSGERKRRQSAAAKGYRRPRTGAFDEIIHAGLTKLSAFH